MSFIYNIGIKITDFALKCLSSFNIKIKLGVIGRSKTFGILQDNLNAKSKTLWFHCASLGEYEQGLPIFKELRRHFYQHKIVLSFFSPSGYEIRKNTPIADIVIYLPLDTRRNAKQFINIVNPELTVFVKYDIWPNFLNEIKTRNLRAVLISALFRKNQPYFKFYGKTLKQALFSFEHIFTQNESSKQLLESIDYKNATVSGDTRFDRVTNQLEQDNTLEFVENFKNNQVCLVAGSTWKEDEQLLINFINSENTDRIKIIIAPHNIKENQIRNLKESLSVKTALYSERDKINVANVQVLIIDSIGILTKIYSYADISYIGGAMGNTGLHNTLEAAVFGVPIIIGKNHLKFPEALTMIENGGMFSVSNQDEFDKILNKLIKNSDLRIEYGSKNSQYVRNNKGAVIQILDYLRI
nr:glycosyltransferase N-terminal domain-containing protein [uncultured Algibacter sp.]